MLMCDEILTLVRHVKEKDSDCYETYMIDGASWFEKSKVEQEGKGLTAADEVMIRIPEENMPEGLKIRTKDILVRGELSGPPSDLAELLEYDTCEVIAVNNNCRGVNPHWAVIGT